MIPGFCSDHNRMKSETNSKRKTGKFTNLWKLNNTLVNNQLIKEKIASEIGKYLDINEMKT